MQSLAGKVAVVTWASRGAGRGITSVLGEAGATVYVTGRSVSRDLTQPELHGTTIEETTELVTAVGALASQSAWTIPSMQRLRPYLSVWGMHGRLDLLVNNAWGGYEDYLQRGCHKSFDANCWEQPIERWDEMWTAGVRATLATTKAALLLMFPQRQGIIVNTTLEIDPTFYEAALYYRRAKLAINYLTFGMAHDLYQRGGFPIALIGLAMGWMRTEAVLENFRQGLDPIERLKETFLPLNMADERSLPWQRIQMFCRRQEKYCACKILLRSMASRMQNNIVSLRAEQDIGCPAKRSNLQLSARSYSIRKSRLRADCFATNARKDI